jgi:hypothetical protein
LFFENMLENFQMASRGEWPRERVGERMRGWFRVQDVTVPGVRGLDHKLRLGSNPQGGGVRVISPMGEFPVEGGALEATLREIWDLDEVTMSLSLVEIAGTGLCDVSFPVMNADVGENMKSICQAHGIDQWEWMTTEWPA